MYITIIGVRTSALQILKTKKRIRRTRTIRRIETTRVKIITEIRRKKPIMFAKAAGSLLPLQIAADAGNRN
jgi:hypothetical protein